MDIVDIIFSVGGYALIGLTAIILISSTIFMVRQQSLAIIERFGRYHRTVSPGLRAKIPFVDRIVRRVPLRVQQDDIEIETKTRDDVFCKVKVAVQRRVIAAHAADSFYQLSDPRHQIQAYVLDDVRAQVPTMSLDEAFAKKDEIAKSVKVSLTEKMKAFGFEIPDVLVVDIDPDAHVKKAMNEIQAQTRLRTAAEQKGEAEKILIVKDAEAHSEAKRLQGEGTAKQRKAIIDGLRESVKELAGIDGVTAAEAMQLVLMTQHFDMMRDVGVSAGSKVIMMSHSPGTVADLAEQIRASVITGSEAAAHPVAPKPTATPAAAPAASAPKEAKKAA